MRTVVNTFYYVLKGRQGTKPLPIGVRHVDPVANERAVVQMARERSSHP